MTDIPSLSSLNTDYVNSVQNDRAGFLSRLVLIAVASFVTTTALAADDFAGKYASPYRDYRQRVEIKRTATGYEADLVVGTAKCDGLFEGAGTVEDGKLILRTTNPDYKDDACRITIARTPKGIAVTEGDNCSIWHGVSCGFEGDKYRKR